MTVQAIRVYYRANALLIDTVPTPFVAGTLTASLNAATGNVEICRIDSGFIFAAIPWGDVADVDGSTFASSAATMAYLAAQFAMRRPLGLTFVQSAVALSWTISHSLGFRPNVSVIDTAGDLCLADVVWPDDATVIVKFGAPTAGTAYLS